MRLAQSLCVFALVAARPSHPEQDRVVYLSDMPYGLHIMAADGTGHRELVAKDQQVLHFDCGPRGVAYVCDPTDIENFELFVLDADKGTRESVFHGIRFFPRWSPDGERLAFMNHSGRWKIQVTNASDYETCAEQCPPEKTRFDDGFSVNDGAPAWSPDGSSLVFQSNRAEKTLDLYIVDLETQSLRQLTRGRRASSPTYSPDGRWIAFLSDQKLLRIRPDGTEEQVVTESGTNDGHRWFPDSSGLLFVSDRSGNKEIWTIAWIDDEPVNLTNNRFEDRSPAISPDGARVLYVSDRDGNDEIYVMDIDGKNVERLTHNEVRDGSPAWYR